MFTSTPEEIPKVKKPERNELYTIRFLIVCAITCMVVFIAWFANPDHVGYGPIFSLLTFALFFKLLKMLHEWYHYWSPSVTPVPIIRKEYTVDMLTTACPGEPREMIIRTLKAMKAVRYPHVNYLCDEGNDPILKKVCEELGIVHVTRNDHTDAKAGNINNALKQASGEICVVLDPDHEPIPEFLDRVLPYFQDNKIGFVQCVQAYGNQEESIIAKGAAEQTYHFYGPMMMCMNSYGTAQAIGANCTFRRAALDSIGGHAAGLAEDMHTSMQLHAKGWKSVYIPEILSRGLVPATLSSYYKQQLKWSRGTFELLFRTYPGLFSKFTWRQRLHYFTIPLYFLFGLINLFDIIVPALALVFAEVPWAVNLGHFTLFFLPLCGLSLIIRLYAQRWLLEKHERGFHFAGGILRTATWWIFLVGFVYSIFKIKVPYIPTPKEDEHRNFIRLSLPNALTSVLCILVVLYGLSIDWTPYSMAMASYLLLNAGMLSFVVIMSQQKFILQLENACRKLPPLPYVGRLVHALTNRSGQLVYSTMRNGPLALIAALSLLSLSYINSDGDIHPFPGGEKKFGGFYIGYACDGNTSELSEETYFESSLKTNLDIISFRKEWPRMDFLDDLERIDRENAIPSLIWDPGSLVGENADHFYNSITNGLHDDYLKECAAVFRSYRKPVFICFAPEFDKPGNKLENTANTPADFVKAWQHIYTFFNNLGISNLTWVWSPLTAQSADYYPGPKFVDWVGLSCLNYENDPAAKDRYSFSQLYRPFRDQLGKFQKPVILTEFGSIHSEGQSEWTKQALTDIKDKYREIKALIIFGGKKHFEINGTDKGKNWTYTADFNQTDPRVLRVMEKEFSKIPFSEKPLQQKSGLTVKRARTSPRQIEGGPGKYKLMVEGKPYYIRGVAYNTGHDWRDGYMPLTRKQLEYDFRKISEMGANTIRRYDHGVYDKNVLNVAGEYGLKVLYGFWFDPAVDYYGDRGRVEDYIHDVEDRVKKFKDHPAVLAWSLGNETWGLLKHRYAKPYLTNVRNEYVKLVELLAERIHKIDPSRPVFTCMEHEEYQLPGELVAFHDGAPEVDAIGVNSYYEEQITKLNHLAWEFDSLRPYIVSEFGPRGYWDPTHNKIVGGQLAEESELEKAQWYKTQWGDYVRAYQGYNLGGFAYCWHDRMEGSLTWFGLTDYKGRLKPSYYALKESWTGQGQEAMISFNIKGPEKILPGGEYNFFATGRPANNAVYNYSWQLLKDDYFEEQDGVDFSKNKPEARIRIPEEPARYRLYLYVDDGKGNVSTTSVPIQVKKIRG